MGGFWREERQKCDSPVTSALLRRERGKERRERWMEAMKGTGEERCSRQRRDVRRGEELEDCREGRIWIGINFLLGHIFMLSRNLSSRLQCERHHDGVWCRNKADRAEERQRDEKWLHF